MTIPPLRIFPAKPSSRQWVGVGILFAGVLALDLSGADFPVLGGYLLAVMWAALLQPAWVAGVLAVAGVVAGCAKPDLIAGKQEAVAWWIAAGAPLLDRLLVLLPAAFLVSRLMQERRKEEKRSREDPLTGLANRRFLQERLEEELNRSRRHAMPFSLVFLDCDGFKAINDRHGHAAGDALLQQLAGVLRRGVRNYDVAARWGGDEFLLLLPGTNREEAEQVVGRLLSAFKAVSAPSGSLSFSVGLVTVKATPALPPLTVETLIQQADEAMYRAKKAGGNGLRAVSLPV